MNHTALLDSVAYYVLHLDAPLDFVQASETGITKGGRPVRLAKVPGHKVGGEAVYIVLTQEDRITPVRAMTEAQAAARLRTIRTPDGKPVKFDGATGRHLNHVMVRLFQALTERLDEARAC
jgi:hypothetical protein